MIGHSSKSQVSECEGGEPYAELKPSATWCYFNPQKAADAIERLLALLKELDDDMWAEKREHYRNSGLGRRVHTELSSH